MSRGSWLKARAPPPTTHQSPSQPHPGSSSHEPWTQSIDHEFKNDWLVKYRIICFSGNRIAMSKLYNTWKKKCWCRGENRYVEGGPMCLSDTRKGALCALLTLPGNPMCYSDTPGEAYVLYWHSRGTLSFVFQIVKFPNFQMSNFEFPSFNFPNVPFVIFKIVIFNCLNVTI